MKTRSTNITIRDMVYAAVFTAALCAVAPFAINIGPIPLTFATLVIYLATGTLGWKLGALSTALYVALGAVGVPVFSNFQGGFHVIAGATGGFIIGYVPCALVAGLVIQALKGKILANVLGMAIGTILLYACGTAWFMFLTGNPLAASLAACVTPFLPGDAIKISLACIAAPKLRAALGAYRKADTGQT